VRALGLQERYFMSYLLLLCAAEVLSYCHTNEQLVGQFVSFGTTAALVLSLMMIVYPVTVAV
jgi:hypothetical protein